MNRLQPKSTYRRRLVHYHQQNGPYFFTINLHGAIPQGMRALRLRQIADRRNRGEERHWFAQLETFLHQCHGPIWLGNSEVARIVQKELHHWDGHFYDLHCYTLMPNHMHLILSPRESTADGGPVTIPMIMHAIKRRSSLAANRYLGRTGTFWQHESFDHYIRSPSQYHRVVQYILENPVKAGLVTDWKQWPWSYVRLT